jgi:hypothetical protein
VSSETNIDALALGQETRNVLAAEAVADGTNLLRTLLLHVCQSLLDNRVDGVRQVALALGAALGQPLHDVEVSAAELVELDGVALEEVGHDGPVAVGGELVGDQLGVDQGVAHDIGENDDGVGGVLVLGVGDVGGDWRGGVSLLGDWIAGFGGNILSLMVVSSPLASPSCLTPMVQHFPGGLEAIVVVCGGGLGGL